MLRNTAPALYPHSLTRRIQQQKVFIQQASEQAFTCKIEVYHTSTGMRTSFMMYENTPTQQKTKQKQKQNIYNKIE